MPHISSLVGKHLERPLSYGEFSIPKGSTILKLRQPIGGDNGTHKLVIGIFHTPDQFLDKSFKLIHAFDHPACTRDVLSRALFETLVTGPSALAEKRTATLNYYAELARKLAPQEDKLHEAIGKDQQNILSDKNFLLLRRMAKDAKYNDPIWHKMALREP